MATLTLFYVLAAIAAALLIYGLCRLVGRQHISGDTHEIATLVLFRIGALHGLILALVFAQELNQYQRVINGVAEEVNALTDIYYDIERYGAPEKTQKAIQDAITHYLDLASTEEWKTLGAARELSTEAWTARETFYTLTLDLEPKTPRQEFLRNHILNEILMVADLRDARASAARYTISPMFWIAALTGFVLTIVPFFVYPPTVVHIALLCSFAAYTGTIFAFISGLSNPFLPPGEVQPTPFLDMLKTIKMAEEAGRG